MRSICFMFLLLIIESTFAMDHKTNPATTSAYPLQPHPEFALLANMLKTKKFQRRKIILVLGSTGAGKSHQIGQLAESLHCTARTQQASDILIETGCANADIPKLLNKLETDILERAKTASTEHENFCFIVFGNIELFFQNEKQLTEDQIPTRMRKAIQEAETQFGIPIIVWGKTCQTPGLWFRRQFDSVIEISLPKKKERYSILEYYAQKAGIKKTSSELEQLSQETKGFTPKEIIQAIEDAQDRMSFSSSDKKEDDFLTSIRLMRTPEHVEHYENAKKRKYENMHLLKRKKHLYS